MREIGSSDLFVSTLSKRSLVFELAAVVVLEIWIVCIGLGGNDRMR
jgi:hypothetical protein